MGKMINTIVASTGVSAVVCSEEQIVTAGISSRSSLKIVYHQ